MSGSFGRMWFLQTERCTPGQNLLYKKQHLKKMNMLAGPAVRTTLLVHSKLTVTKKKHTLQTRRRSEYALVVVLVVCANKGFVSWAVSLTVLRITLVTFNYFTCSLNCKAACCPSKSPCIHYSVYLSVLENTNLTQILNSSNLSLSLETLLVIIKAMQN